MTPLTLAPELRAAAPEAAKGLRVILTGLATLIAAGLLRQPRYVAVIFPLWNRLNRAARRFDRLMAHIAAGTLRIRPSRPGRPGGKPPAKLPATRAWLLAALKHEAAHYTNRLETLLSDPATAALVAATPQAVRILRPLCHMLGVSPAVLPRRPRKPRARPEQAGTPSPGEAATACTSTAAPGFLRPSPESAPCAHVGWPWFPGRFSPGKPAHPPPDHPSGLHRLAHGFL